MNPKMLGHFKTNSNYNLWLAHAVGLVGQKSCSRAFFFFFKDISVLGHIIFVYNFGPLI